MNIPEQFKIANQIITVKIVDKLPDNSYGHFCDVTNVIEIARSIKLEDDYILLTQEQLSNTFWHEVFHAFQFYFNTDTDEAQAQCYANFMRELLATAGNPF